MPEHVWVELTQANGNDILMCLGPGCVVQPNGSGTLITTPDKARYQVTESVDYVKRLLKGV
jgi:hypothetical protein